MKHLHKASVTFVYLGVTYGAPRVSNMMPLSQTSVTCAVNASAFELYALGFRNLPFHAIIL